MLFKRAEDIAMKGQNKMVHVEVVLDREKEGVVEKVIVKGEAVKDQIKVIINSAVKILICSSPISKHPERESMLRPSKK